MVASPETGVTEMEMTMEEGLNMNPRELTLDELEDASGGMLPLLVGAFIVGFSGGLWVGRALAHALD
jgi:lactobin A/cerein 7B family class IIb bacteriocin